MSLPWPNWTAEEWTRRAAVLDEPRTAGDIEGHDFHGNQWTKTGGTQSDSTAPKVRSEKSLRALKAFKPAGARVQRAAEAAELEVRNMLGGTRTEGNFPVDVITEIDGKIKGIEVKRMTSNTNDKLTVRASAHELKDQWAHSQHATTHTVAFDDRPKDLNSGHRIYYRKGTGSFRLANMIKVENKAHLRRLLAA